jgi:hypothetical protein
MKRLALAFAGLGVAALLGAAVGGDANTGWVDDPATLGPFTYSLPNPCDPSLVVTMTEMVQRTGGYMLLPSGHRQFQYTFTTSGSGVDNATPPHHYTTSGFMTRNGTDRVGDAGGVATNSAHYDFVSSDGGSSFREQGRYHVTGLKGDEFNILFQRGSLICLGGPNEVPKVVIGK